MTCARPSFTASTWRAQMATICRTGSTATGGASSTWVTSPGSGSKASNRPILAGARDPRFRTGLRALLPVRDELIERFNRETGLDGRA